MKVIDATLARRDKAMAAMRSLQESLQELLFMKALVWLVSANGKDEKCENAYHFAGCSVRYNWRRLKGQRKRCHSQISVNSSPPHLNLATCREKTISAPSRASRWFEPDSNVGIGEFPT